MLLAFDETQWYVVAAFISAAAGLITTYIALRNSRKQTSDTERLRYEEQLRLLRSENERLAADLHRERMRYEDS
jgi:hypothetical protein